MSRLLARLVNWLVRDVKIARLRVLDLHVGEHSTVLTGNYIEFDALGTDPAVAATGKARLCAVNADLRVSHAAAYSTVGSGGGGGGSSDFVSRTGLVTMAPVATAVLETTAGAGVAAPSASASASVGSVGAGAAAPSLVGSAALI